MQHNSHFVSYYNKIDKYLSDVLSLRSYMWFQQKITMVRRSDSVVALVIEKYLQDLLLIGSLRNKIVHTYNNYISINQKALTMIASIYHEMTHPRDCRSFHKDVYVCASHHKISHVLDIMKQENNTHVPVYHSGEFQGILSESVISYRLSGCLKRGETIEKARVWDIDLTLWNEYVLFEKTSLSMYEAEQRFVHWFKEKKRLWAIFLTQQGSSSQEMLGIITAWDIPKMVFVV